MMTQRETEALSDDVLLSRLQGVLRESRELLADVLALLGEVDARRLYLQKAYPSLFAYCVAELRLSEDEAFARIQVARLCRRLPLVLEALRTGSIHLTAARLLAPHFTLANCEALLAEAKGLSKREVEELVARLAPQPPVPDVIRKLPVRWVSDVAPTPSAVVSDGTELPALPLAPLVASPAASSAAVEGIERTFAEQSLTTPVHAAATPSRPPQATLAPLSEDAFKVQFTAPRSLRDKLREAQALLGDEDVASVMEKALDLLLVDVKKRRFALVPSPRKEALPTVRGAERHIPAAIRRALYQRDKGRCTFQSDDGHRCNETRHLEFDHIQGFARMREHSVDGIRLLCRRHNQLQAKRVYADCPWLYFAAQPMLSTDGNSRRL
ncbi:MAG: HNH endonuclease [Myxococcaceae bacterium]